MYRRIADAESAWDPALEGFLEISSALRVLLAALLALHTAYAGEWLTQPGGESGNGGMVVPLVVALGDSLTAGTGLLPDQAYPALLQQKMRDAGYRHEMVNAGLSGSMTADGLRRLDRELMPDTEVLIVALGANDGLQGVAVETVRANLAAIIERAQERGIRVLLCGMETPPTRGWSYTLEFRQIFPELAAHYRVPLMPFLLSGVAGIPEFNLPDGIHPNAAGARRIAENMWPHLERLIKTSSA